MSAKEALMWDVNKGMSVTLAAEVHGVTRSCAYKWVDRYRREGLAGLQDRSSRPHRIRLPTPAAVVAEIERLRRQRWTGKQIAIQVGVSRRRFCCSA